MTMITIELDTTPPLTVRADSERALLLALLGLGCDFADGVGCRIVPERAVDPSLTVVPNALVRAPFRMGVAGIAELWRQIVAKHVYLGQVAELVELGRQIPCRELSYGELASADDQTLSPAARAAKVYLLANKGPATL